MGEAEWEPWIELDGSGAPDFPGGTIFECVFSGPGVTWPNGHAIMTDTWPGFFWRWRNVRVNWFESVRRRVCDQPDYAPIIRIRFQKPPSTATDRLAEIVAKPPGVWIKDATDSDNRLPKRVKA